jgi:hypothetical protein
MVLRRRRSAIPGLAATIALLAALPGPAVRAVPQQRGTAPAVHPRAADEAPSVEHAVLQRLVGVWSARLKVSEGAGPRAGRSRATETNRTCCGALFVLTELDGKSKKVPTGGRGILGYDPARGRYILAWADARSASLATGDGIYDPEADTLTFQYTRRDGNGGTEQVREVFAWDGPDRRSRTVSTVGEDGSNSILLTITYRRR